VRRDVLKALGDLGDTRALPAIVQELLADEKALGDKVYAAEALGKLGDATAIEPLVRANETSRRRERETIATVLASPDRRYRDNFYVNRISTQ
jgi:HEAT repeat protein